jgi:pimeloyl-ACP methyl ester carboxylesterase
LVFAWPLSPQPPGTASVSITQIRSTSVGVAASGGDDVGELSHDCELFVPVQRAGVGEHLDADVVAANESEPEVHEDYVSAYDLGRFAESARFVRHYPEQNPVLRDVLPTMATPTQILAERDDDLVPWSNNQYLHDLLPNSEIHPLNAGHFAWEQAPEEYGGLVAEWVSGGYRRVEASSSGRGVTSWLEVALEARTRRDLRGPGLIGNRGARA